METWFYLALAGSITLNIVLVGWLRSIYFDKIMYEKMIEELDELDKEINND